MASEIRIPHRKDPVTEEEAAHYLTEALWLVHVLIGSYCKNLPDEVVARAHKFFEIQAVPGSKGCSCESCKTVEEELHGHSTG